jgi:hypothetical protein
MEAAKAEAKRLRQSPTNLEVLQIWFSRKYQLPWNHAEFQNSTEFDLLTEYYYDYFEKNPLEAHTNADGKVQFTNTGDNFIDRWEELIAQGQEVDLREAFADGELEKIQQKLARAKLTKARAG